MNMRGKERGGRGKFLFWRTDFIGVAMVVTGLFFLMVNFNLIPVSDFVLSRALGILFITVGLIFLFFQGAGGGLFWFVLPTGFFFTLGFLTLLMGVDALWSVESFAVFCAGTGLTFLAVFVLRRNQWWALIPAFACMGVSGWLTSASWMPVIGFHPVLPVFCVGLSFLVIYLNSVQKRRMRWSFLTGSIIVALSFAYLLLLLLSRWKMLWPVLLLLFALLLPLTGVFVERARKRSASR
jgi:hypothetical protein